MDSYWEQLENINKKIDNKKNNLCDINQLNYDKKLSIEDTIVMHCDNSTKFIDIFNDDKEFYFGNFSIEIDNKYSLTDAFNYIELSIGGMHVTRIYPENNSALSLCQDYERKDILYKTNKTIYNLSGIRYLKTYRFHTIRFTFYLKNKIENFNFIYERYNNYCDGLTDSCSLIPFYQTRCITKSIYDNTNLHKIVIDPIFNILYINLELYNTITKKNTKISSDNTKKITLCFNSEEVVINNRLLQIFEQKYGHGTIPFNKKNTFVNQIKNITLNLNKILNLSILIQTKDINNEYNSIRIYDVNSNVIIDKDGCGALYYSC